MQTLIIETEGRKLDALVAILEALEISFKSSESPYSAEFVQKIKQSETEAKKGEIVELEEGQDLWDLAITE